MSLSIFLTISFFLMSEAIRERVSLGRAGFLLLMLVTVILILFSYLVFLDASIQTRSLGKMAHEIATVLGEKQAEKAEIDS